MSYGFRVEIQGDYACFSRPELKVERVSYEVITPSAVRGILEAVFWKPAIKYVVDQINICKPIRFENIRRNELSSDASYKKISIQSIEKKLLSGDLYINASQDRTQRTAMVLRDVQYVVEFHFVMTDKSGPDDNEGKFSAILRRRLEKGQNYHTPYLGVREFPASIRLIADGETMPNPILDSRSLGLMLYDIDFIKTIGKDGHEAVAAFEPTYFIAKMEQGIISLQDVEVLR